MSVPMDDFFLVAITQSRKNLFQYVSHVIFLHYLRPFQKFSPFQVFSHKAEIFEIQKVFKWLQNIRVLLPCILSKMKGKNETKLRSVVNSVLMISSTSANSFSTKLLKNFPLSRILIALTIAVFLCVAQ